VTKLSDLIATCDVEEVLRQLVAARPREEKSLQGYREVITELRQTLSMPTGGRLLVQYSSDILNSDPYWDVVMYDADESRWSTSFVPWTKLLDRDVSVQGGDLTEAQALAHILYDITFHGFTSAEVEEEGDRLKEMGDELDELLATLPENPTDEDYEAIGLHVWKPSDFGVLDEE